MSFSSSLHARRFAGFLLGASLMVFLISLRVWLEHVLDTNALLVLLTIPVIFGAWISGRAVGLLLSVLGTSLAFYTDNYLLQSRLVERAYLVDLALFFLISIVISYLIQGLQKARQESGRRLRTISESERFAASIFEGSTDCIFVTDLTGNVLAMNVPGLTAMELTKDELVKQTVASLWNLSYQQKAQEMFQRAVHGKPGRFEASSHTASGEECWWDVAISPVSNPKDGVSRLVCVARDNTEHRSLSRIIQRNEDRFRFLVDSVKDYAIFTLDHTGFITTWNTGAERILGYPSDEILGKHIDVIFTAEDRAANKPQEELLNAAATGRGQDNRWHVRRDGTQFWANGIVTPLLDEKGELLGFTKVLRDETERRHAEETIRHQALHDALTGLPNRLLMEDRLEQALLTAKRDNQELALLFLDLDNFKNINDTLGHQVGDFILQEVANRLRTCVRIQDTVARLGGDEFTVLLTDIQSRDDVLAVVRQIQGVLESVFKIINYELHTAASMGIALFPGAGEDAQTLFKNADTALYRAKEHGKNTYEFYDAGMKLSATRRLSLENDLRQAVKRGEFSLHYQPIVDMTTGKISGAEALVRWKHISKGMIPPVDFIPIAEEIGLISQLSEFTVRTVCRQIREWEKQGISCGPISLNLSARQFTQQDLVPMLEGIYTEEGCTPQSLKFEITESFAMQNVKLTIVKLSELRGKGIGVALDDFGTGHSSLNYLKRLPVDTLKIDRSFVAECTTDPQDATIVEAIISMSHSLGLKVVAEGVETREQLLYLRTLKCDFVQGYHFSEALPTDAFTELLKVRKFYDLPA